MARAWPELIDELRGQLQTATSRGDKLVSFAVTKAEKRLIVEHALERAATNEEVEQPVTLFAVPLAVVDG